MIKVGCCGFPRAFDLYVRTFRLVEIQQTFYRLPRVSTVRRWRERAPEGFEFTMKAWQLITHPPTSPTYRRLGRAIPPRAAGRYGGFRPSREVLEAWEATREVARALGATVVVFQCPASFAPTPENTSRLRAFFTTIDRGGLRLGWEPRGAWDPAVVARLCAELDLIHCTDPFTLPPAPGPIRYFRLHGRTGYRYRYTDEDLEQLRRWCGARRVTFYVLFNNVAMWEDARRFASLVGRPS